MKYLKLAVAVGTLGLVLRGAEAAEPPMKLVPASDVVWTPIDPKAGTKGPQISVVFGDMKMGPVGLFLKIPAGGKPGPHIHTSDYYAVQVFGTEHDWLTASTDEGKKLPPGSWWYQAGGVGHNNHCEAGTDCVMFLYLPKGFDMAPDPKAPKQPA